jgi:antitoxin VapB
MNAYREVKLLRNCRDQSVRIPREFELPGEDAIMRREGDKLVIKAMPPKSLLAILAELGPIEEGFPEIADLLPDSIAL